MRFPRMTTRRWMIAMAVVVGLLPILRTLAADYRSKAPAPPVVYASLTTQADEDRRLMLVGVVCSVLFAMIALIPVCRWPMTTRRWMLAVAFVAGVIWIESSLYHHSLLHDWGFPGTVWALLQLPLGLVLGQALFLWYWVKWLRSPVPPPQ